MPGRAANALPLLRRALALDPTYALAHGLAAMCCHNRFLRAGFKEADRAASVRHARQALEHGRDDALALTFAGSASAWTRMSAPPPSARSRPC
jgi:hypothetical protein